MPTSVSRAAGLALKQGPVSRVGAGRIRVNSGLVGAIRSGQYERMAADRGVTVDDVLAERAQELGIPLGRAGRPEEFADLTAFLLSARSAYLTGAAITLDDGSSTSL